MNSLDCGRDGRTLGQLSRPQPVRTSGLHPRDSARRIDSAGNRTEALDRRNGVLFDARDPSPSPMTSATRPSRAKRLWPYLQRYGWHFTIGVVFLIATNLLALRIPRQIGAAVQLLRGAHGSDSALDLDRVRHFGVVIALLALGAGVTRVLSRIFVFNGGRQIEYDIRNEVFDHLCRLDGGFYQQWATGDLVSRTINDVTQIRLLFGVGILNIVNTSVAYVIVLVLMFDLSTKLTLLCLAPYPFVLFTVIRITRALYTRTRAMQGQLSVLSAAAQEALAGAVVVKTYAIEDRVAARFLDESNHYVDRNMDLAVVRGGLMPYMRVVAGLGTLIALWFGGAAVVTGELTLGEFVEFSAYVVGLAWPTMALGWVLSVYNRGSASFDRTMQILDTAPTIVGGEGDGAAEGRPTHAIVFDDVHVVHDDGTVALKGVDLDIAGGSVVAIVGPTGSGKSTLVELIPRLCDPTRGQVRIGEVPLRELALGALRGRIGFAPQEGFLFSTTLRENVRFGVPDGDEGLPVERTLQVSQLEADLVALPHGLDTVVGERGVTLSGGQRQRATIARALGGDPEILILDDALASVDTRTERAILTELADAARGRTTVLVTHRFNALDLVDEVIVLEDGEVVERGPHRELIARGGRYAELVELQNLEASLE